MNTVNDIGLTVNGARRTAAEVDVRTTLLDLLRDRFGLTGTKKGCDHGVCGACTVHLDGERVLSCLTLAVSVTGRTVRTIEAGSAGTSTDTATGAGELDPLPEAFLRHDAFQCGYCTPGQIMSARAMLHEHARGDLSAETFDAHDGTSPPCLTRGEIRERMAGNICRCGAYANIVAAIEDVSRR